MATLKYKETYGDILVPNNYVIPADDSRWPEDLRSFKLARTVGRIRSGAFYQDELADL